MEIRIESGLEYLLCADALKRESDFLFAGRRGGKKILPDRHCREKGPFWRISDAADRRPFNR